MSQAKNNHKVDYVFYLFIDPSCQICENLTKSPSFKKLRRIIAANGTIKIEVYNRSDGGIGSFLCKHYNIDGVPTLFNPQDGRKMYVPFRSITELENLITHQAGLFERLAKEEEEKKRKKSVKIREIYKTIVRHFPTQWFTARDLKEKLKEYSMNTIRVALHRLKERGELAYDPFNHAYKLLT